MQCRDYHPEKKELRSVVVSSASSYIEDFMNSKINKEQYYKKGKKIRKVIKD